MGLRLGTSDTNVRWKRIAGFERYAISEKGEVKNVETERILKLSSDKYGNTHVTLYRDAKPHTKRPAGLVKKAFGGYFD